MIFLSVGTQLPFDRMINIVDEWMSHNPDIEIIGQIAEGQYIPNHLKHEKFIPAVEFAKLYSKADIIISHAGMGNIISALEHSKPIIIFPRKVELGEHRNNHQYATSKKFINHPLISVVEDYESFSKVMSESDLLINAGKEFELVNSSGDLLTRYLFSLMDEWF